LVDNAASEALEDRLGAQSLRVRLAELLFMESLRLYMQTLAEDATGWFAGLRDPVIGRALQALHDAPARLWSVEALAETVGNSCSSLAARFREILGEPPMHYLTRLRMQLAARHLHEYSWSVDRVAEEVGYDSTAAFQRAFNRTFGVPPATWRQSVDGSVSRSENRH
jgi:AraC-like DNA-binding protein